MIRNEHASCPQSRDGADLENSSAGSMLRRLAWVALGAALMTSGCSKEDQGSKAPDPTPPPRSEPAVQSQAIAPNAAEPIVPTISSAGKDSIGILDRNTMLKENRGYLADMNGDGIDDLTIMRDTTVYYSRGLGDNKFAPEVVIAKMSMPVVAYSIGKVGNFPRPSLVYYDNNDKGFVQQNMGPDTNGIPFFGEVEALDFNGGK